MTIISCFNVLNIHSTMSLHLGHCVVLYKWTMLCTHYQIQLPIFQLNTQLNTPWWHKISSLRKFVTIVIMWSRTALASHHFEQWSTAIIIYLFLTFFCGNGSIIYSTTFKNKSLNGVLLKFSTLDQMFTICLTNWHSL